MSVTARSLSAFHRIGERAGVEAATEAPRGLRPALFAAYSQLSALRYDFPLVLAGQDSGAWVKSLTDLMDELLREIAPQGAAGEELRRQVLSLEQEIRKLAGERNGSDLSSLWQEARDALLSRSREEDRDRLAANLARTRTQLPFDGKVVDFDAAMPASLLTRGWRASERSKAQQLQFRIERLARKLSDILRADYMHSSAAREPSTLAGSMGQSDENVFDFQAMAQILNSPAAAPALPTARRQRIQRAIEVLDSQRFVGENVSESPLYTFRYDDCSDALAAFRERLADMAELVKAIAIAELEIENRYAEETHDQWFARFNPEMLGPDDLALFPSYLVCMDKAADDPAARAEVLSILQAGLPFKILALSSDPLGDPAIASGQLSFGTQGQQLAAMAMGLGSAFVMQAPGSSLYRLKDSVLDGMRGEHAALFSVYSGQPPMQGEHDPAAPAYLMTAAAGESRTFPCFVYDPGAGSDLAARFRLDGNPDPHSDWPRHNFDYEGPQHDRRSLETACTLVDFVAADPRFSDRFACVGANDEHQELLALDEFLELDSKAAVRRVPFVWLIDEENLLYRAVVDHRLVDAARRCRDNWRRLGELGGIDNSHARRALAAASAEWLQEKQALQARAAATPAAPAAASAQVSAASPSPAAATAETAVAESPTEEAAAPALDSDDPWIETVRCTTCNECTQINDRMFAYDADKRAYIADPDAGTYRELVEAAETCQVAIIHPGKPRNPDEPGLEALLERAAPFM